MSTMVLVKLVLEVTLPKLEVVLLGKLVPVFTHQKLEVTMSVVELVDTLIKVVTLILVLPIPRSTRNILTSLFPVGWDPARLSVLR